MAEVLPWIVLSAGFIDEFAGEHGHQKRQEQEKEKEEEENDDEIDVKDPSSKSQLTNAFKKHMNGKMVNKVILSKFAGQIAWPPAPDALYY